MHIQRRSVTASKEKVRASAPTARSANGVRNLLGLLDRVLAVTLGVLASATPIGPLAGDVTTRLMGHFPLSLIPTFFVPLLMICHLIALSRVRKKVL
jgi:hypothetical protein